MKAFIDGDAWCVTDDDFVDLQNDFAIFFPLNSWMGKKLSKDGIDGLTEGEKEVVRRILDGTAATGRSIHSSN